jgi:hypothetical protein
MIACGLALITAIPGYSANLVANPGFETGDFTGWVADSSPFLYVDTANPHSGTYSAHMGNNTSLATLGQALATTAGGTYTLSFFLQVNDSGTPNEFKVIWDGTTIFDQTDMTAAPYSLYTFTNLVASSASTDLQFLHRHDPDHFFLDDISVLDEKSITDAPIPEPGQFGLLCLGSMMLVAAAFRRRAALNRAGLETLGRR